MQDGRREEGKEREERSEAPSEGENLEGDELRFLRELLERGAEGLKNRAVEAKTKGQSE